MLLMPLRIKREECKIYLYTLIKIHAFSSKYIIFSVKVFFLFQSYEFMLLTHLNLILFHLLSKLLTLKKFAEPRLVIETLAQTCLKFYEPTVIFHF